MWKSAFVPFMDLFIEFNKQHNKNYMKVQHYHDSYEIYLQISGDRYLFHDDLGYTLQPGDLVILKPFDIHCTQSGNSEYYQRYVLNFKAEMLSDVLTKAEMNLLFQKLNRGLLHLDESQKQHLLYLLQQLDKTTEKTGPFMEKVKSTSLFHVLLYIIELADAKDDNSLTSFASASMKLQQEIIDALQYMNKNYMNYISLDTMVEITHLSKFHFSRIFHESTGATFYDYLTNIRLTKVHQLLIDTKLSIKQIASKTGFSSSDHLTKTFKRVYFITPRDFRKGINKI